MDRRSRARVIRDFHEHDLVPKTIEVRRAVNRLANTVIVQIIIPAAAGRNLETDVLPCPHGLSAVLALIAVGFLLVGLALVPIPMLYAYDDGVYFLDAQRFIAGDRPYTDFYLAHPPGIVWMNAAFSLFGPSIIVCRIVSWIMAVVFVGLLARFLSRVSGEVSSARPTAWLGVFFLSTTQLYLDAASQILTQLPVMLLTLMGFFFLLPDRSRPVLAGAMLAAASAFRVQAAFIGPAWVVFIFVTYGWVTGRGMVLRLTLAAAAGAILFHGAMELTHPKYLDCIIRSHTTRPATSLGTKVEILNGLFHNPQVAVGLIAAAVLASRGRGPVRGLGAFVVIETLLTLFGSRFLMDGYFLPIYPYLLGCGAILIVRFAEEAESWQPVLATVAVIVIVGGIPIAGKIIYRWTEQRRFEADLIARVQAAPGTTVICTPGKIPLFAGKELVRDYLCPDTTSPIVSDFGTWFVSLAHRADVIVITDTAVDRLSPDECRVVQEMGKPIVFGTPADEKEFRRRAADGKR